MFERKLYHIVDRSHCAEQGIHPFWPGESPLLWHGRSFRKQQLVNSDYSSSKGYKKAKNQACHLCDYTAAHRNNLTYHLIKVHKIGEMFKCEQCTYESASKGNLKAHVEGVHEKLRKYACSECDYAGFRRSEWIKHQKTKRHQNRRTIGIGIGVGEEP